MERYDWYASNCANAIYTSVIITNSRKVWPSKSRNITNFYLCAVSAESVLSWYGGSPSQDFITSNFYSRGNYGRRDRRAKESTNNNKQQTNSQMQYHDSIIIFGMVREMCSSEFVCHLRMRSMSICSTSLVYHIYKICTIILDFDLYSACCVKHTHTHEHSTSTHITTEEENYRWNRLASNV